MNRRQQGYTLVELMISLLLGLMLISGFGGLFSQTQKNSTIQRSLSYMMEDGRYVLEIFGKELRRTGFLRSREGTGNGNGKASVVFTRHPADPPADPPVDPTTDPFVFGSNIDLLQGEYIRGADNATPFGPGLVLRYQLNDRAELAFNEPSSDNSPCTRTIHLRAEEVTYWNPLDDTDPANVLPKKPETVRHVVTLYFYVALDASNAPVLYCEAKRRDWDYPTDTDPDFNRTSGAEPLISNVHQLLITYGIDTDADGAANYYENATNIDIPGPPTWQQVVSAKLSVVLRSEDDNLTRSPTNYDIDGITYQTFDNRLYRVFSTTIAFRN